MLKDLVGKYPDVFTDMPGDTDVIQHQTNLTGDTPIRCKLYPLPYAMREELQNGVDIMLDGSGETVDITVGIAYHHGEEEGYF